MIDLQITADELMHTQVLTFPIDAPITEAIQSLEEFQITGAPVVDAGGNLVGVLTASDIARTGHVQNDGVVAQRGDFYLADPLDEGDGSMRRGDEFAGKDDYSSELLGRETVGDWMTPRVISVAPTASAREVCQVMARESIHRVFVVDRSRLFGIVTTFDIVRYLANNL